MGVPDHVPKVKDFFEKECWAHHPKPHQSYVDFRTAQDAAFEKESKKLIPGLSALVRAYVERGRLEKGAWSARAGRSFGRPLHFADAKRCWRRAQRREGMHVGFGTEMSF